MDKKILKSIIGFFLFGLFLLPIFSCNETKAPKLSEKGKMLVSQDWLLDTTHSATKKFHILYMGHEKSDPQKLSYRKSYDVNGEARDVLGYWEYNEEKNELVFREWNKLENEEMPEVVYEVLNISKIELAVKDKKTGQTDYYLSQFAFNHQ